MIVVSITGPTTEDAVLQVRASARWADIIEFRLDLIQQLDLRRIFRTTRKPRIATLRPEWEGGRFKGTENERFDLLLEAGARGAEYIDIEHAAGKKMLLKLRARLPRTMFIVSSHPGRASLSGSAAYRELRAAGADIVKWAFPAEDASDLRHVVDFLQAAARDRAKAVAIAMGEPGEASRILYRKFRGWATYAAAEAGPGAAPGQLTASTLRRIFRAHNITPTTRVFGVLGYPLGQSKGVYVHNALFARHNVNAVYVKFPTNDLALFMRNVMPWVAGCSVTLPYKEEVGSYCDRLEENAARIGAVNTLLRRKGNLVGLNTDAAAALDVIEREIAVNGKTMLVVGAGGAARAIVVEAQRRGATVVIANRNFRRAEALARECGGTAISCQALGSVKFDVLANATSVGMYPDVESSPVPKEVLRVGMVVFDAVYNPPHTRLLRDAILAGARTVSGKEMYINQAAGQARLFLRRKPDVLLMRATLATHL